MCAHTQGMHVHTLSMRMHASSVRMHASSVRTHVRIRVFVYAHLGFLAAFLF